MLLQGCYLSHQLGDGGDEVSVDVREWDDSEVLETDSEVLRDGITGTQDGITPEQNRHNSGISKDQTSQTSQTSQPGTWMEPILERVDPEEGCINKDLWMSVHGSRIHWEATITVTYPFSGRSVVFDGPNKVDECGRDLVDWQDNSLIRFRTPENSGVNSGTQEYGGTGWVSGDYLVKVTNPNGVESNEVGFDLQFCSGVFDEVPGCENDQ